MEPIKAIADASSLIVLARQDALWLLQRVLGTVTLVPEVEVETVVQGKAKGYTDATRIESAIATGGLSIIAPTPAEKRLASSLGRSAPTLSRTDCLTLACAKERRLTLIMEEQRGRNVASANGIAYVIILVLPLQGFIAGNLTFAECDDLLTRIGAAMRTDRAILTILRAAADEIRRLRATSARNIL
jgi:predicted nucleic acid-binding protein